MAALRTSEVIEQLGREVALKFLPDSFSVLNFSFSLHTPLAHVGLARTRAAAGDTDGARREYQAFLDLWSGADPDLTLLRNVKAELAKLGS